MKKINWAIPVKKAGILLGCFVLSFSIFFSLWKSRLELFASILFGTVALAAAVYYIVYNRGILGRLPTAEELPSEWDETTRNRLVADLKERRKKSEWALNILIPIAFTFAVKMLDIAVFSKLEAFAWLSALLS